SLRLPNSISSPGDLVSYSPCFLPYSIYARSMNQLGPSYGSPGFIPCLRYQPDPRLGGNPPKPVSPGTYSYTLPGVTMIVWDTIPVILVISSLAIKSPNEAPMSWGCV